MRNSANSRKGQQAGPAHPGLAQVQAEHGGGTGIAFAWEVQLLATPVPEETVAAGDQA
jgi:hypothetical protein